MLKKISIVVPFALSNKGFSLWTQVRCEEGELNGLQEFPGGQVEKGETPLESAVREYEEEVGISIEQCDLGLFSMHHYKYSDRNLVFYVHTLQVSEKSTKIAGLTEQKITWESMENDVEQALFPAANKEFLQVMGRFFKKQMGLSND